MHQGINSKGLKLIIRILIIYILELFRIGIHKCYYYISRLREKNFNIVVLVYSLPLINLITKIIRNIAPIVTHIIGITSATIPIMNPSTVLIESAKSCQLKMSG